MVDSHNPHTEEDGDKLHWKGLFDSSETKDFQETDATTNSQVTVTSLPIGLKLHPADLQSHHPSQLTRLFSAHPLQYPPLFPFQTLAEGLGDTRDSSFAPTKKEEYRALTKQTKDGVGTPVKETIHDFRLKWCGWGH